MGFYFITASLHCCRIDFLLHIFSNCYSIDRIDLTLFKYPGIDSCVYWPPLSVNDTVHLLSPPPISLPHRPSVPTSTTLQPQVTWTIEANHAGGYQYRLCPATSKLDEACFQKMPLQFTGMQGLRWNGGPQHGGQEIFFNPTYVTEGTTPPSSQWVKNPIPLLGCGDGLPGPCKVPEFQPLCTNTTMCTGFGDGDVTNSRMVLVDYVKIPNDIPAGDYVLGWRWDCEQSNQIWQSCSDVTIVSE